MNRLHLKIITPEKMAFEEEDIEAVSVPTSEGEITLLPHHIPLVARVVPGEIMVKKANHKNFLVITTGFLQIDANGQVVILADYAIRSEEIEIAKVNEAKKKAEETLKEKASTRDFAIAEAELRRTLLELKVAQRRRTSGRM